MLWAAYGSLDHRAKRNVQASTTLGSLLRGQPLYLIVPTIFINQCQVVLEHFLPS